MNWPTSSRMRIRWASAVLRSGAIGASATHGARGRPPLDAPRDRLGVQAAALADGTTATRVPEIANVAEDAGLTIPANAGPTAAAIALRSRLTPMAPLPA